MVSANESFSIVEAFRFSWRTIINYKGTVIIVLAMALLFAGSLYAANVYITPFFSGDSAFSFITFQAIPGLIIIIGWVFGMVLATGLIKIALYSYEQKKLKLINILPSVILIFKYATASILYGIIVFGGLILIVIPGIIWAVQFSFCFLLIADKHVGPWDALVKSSFLTHGEKRNLLLFFLLLVMINIIGFMALAIGLLVSIPLSVFAYTCAYRRILSEKAV